jgi:hypothetical protein
MVYNEKIEKFIKDHQGTTVHLTNGTSIRFTKAAAETALHLLKHRFLTDKGVGYNDVFPSIARLAEMAGVKDRAIQLRLAQLERLGLVRRVARYREDGRSTSNRYVFAIPETQHRRSARPAVDRKQQVVKLPNSAPPKPCASKNISHNVQYTPPEQIPYTLKGDVDLNGSTSLDPTYLDHNYNYDRSDADYQQSQTAAISNPTQEIPSEIVVFCSHFQATNTQKAALIRAFNTYGAEITTEAISATLANIDRVKLPFNYAIGAAAQIAQKRQYLATVQQEKEARRIVSEREEIVLRAGWHYRDASRVFGSLRAFAMAVFEVTLLRRADQREIVEEISRRIFSPGQVVA